MSALIPAIVLAVAAVFFVLYPVLSGREAPMEREESELTEAQHRKNVALLALRDIEYDYHAGKLDDADYRTLRQQISAEALEALDAEEAERLGRNRASAGAGASAVERAGIEAEIAALRASIREGTVCTHCGHPNPRGSRYCGDCGAALPIARVG
jgi:cytochrome c-type biogenesis protein CcmI